MLDMIDPSDYVRLCAHLEDLDNLTDDHRRLLAAELLMPVHSEVEQDMVTALMARVTRMDMLENGGGE